MSGNVRLTLAYDGTDFSGWQRQRTERTVQAVVEDALGRMLSESIRVQAAGRTDSGVHAIGQVINFTTSAESFPVDRWAVATNSYLPADVRALDGGPVPEWFDSRRSALARGYHYNILANGAPHPHLRRHCYSVPRQLDVAYLNRAASYLVGEQDFSVFAAAGDSSVSRVRRVISASFAPRPPFLVFRIVASSFLWRMVRSIVGTLLDLADQQAPHDYVRQLILGGERDLVGQTAPARGLFLERVWYPAGAWEGRTVS